MRFNYGCSHPNEERSIQSGSERQMESSAAVFEQWDLAIRTQHYRELIDMVRPVYLAAGEDGNEQLKADAGIYLAQAHLPLGHYDSTKMYLQAVTPAIRQDEAEYRSLIFHNLCAVLAIQTGLDYAQALTEFFRARMIAHEIGHRSSEGLLLCNIASIYLIRKDTSGLEYAREAYRLGCKIKDTLVYAQSLQIMAQLHEMAGNYRNALALAHDLESLSSNIGEGHHRIMSHVVMGNALRGLGEQSNAAAHYTEALRLAKGTDDAGIRIYIDLNYGNFLSDSGKTTEARLFFENGLALSVRNNNLRYQEQLLLALAEVCYRLNDTNGALSFYRKYHAFADSLPLLQRERSFNRLLIRNEKLEYDKVMQAKELSLVKARHRTSIIIGLLIFAVLVAGSIYLLYIHQNRMYRTLVEKYRQIADVRRQTLRTYKDANKEDTKLKRLYGNIESAMRERHFYRQNDLSLETIALLLDTNKFDVSRAINRFADMTFYNYINSYRIREAIHILSDPANDMPIKVLYQYLGFNSLSVFYNSFIRETGVPPSKFRKIIQSQ